ncbi:MAG TPA: hypothetical protein VMV10_23110 [Pirellulales bacterium]|nr:hypothetical protein [Pirellulales bacterium]
MQQANANGSGQIGSATRRSLRLLWFGNQRIRQGKRTELVAGRVTHQPLIMHLQEGRRQAVFLKSVSGYCLDLEPKTHHLFLIGRKLPI